MAAKIAAAPGGRPTLPPLHADMPRMFVADACVSRPKSPSTAGIVRMPRPPPRAVQAPPKAHLSNEQMLASLALFWLMVFGFFFSVHAHHGQRLSSSAGRPMSVVWLSVRTHFWLAAFAFGMWLIWTQTADSAKQSAPVKHRERMMQDLVERV